METLTRAFSLANFDLKLKHYSLQSQATNAEDLLADHVRLHRDLKPEVLSFINLFLNKNALALNLAPNNYIANGQKAERMIAHAPEHLSIEEMQTWLMKNWRVFA